MEPFHFAYNLNWTREMDAKLSPNKALATRAVSDARDLKHPQFVIDFGGPKLGKIPEENPPQAIASCSANSVIIQNQVFHNPFNDTWRVFLKLEPKPGNKSPVDIRCTLKQGEEVVSETWTYLWSPL
jgi:glucans biosynthesis protein